MEKWKTYIFCGILATLVTMMFICKRPELNSDYKAFNKAKINGIIRYVGIRSKRLGLSIWGDNEVYLFQVDQGIKLRYPDFEKEAEIGDSIFKAPYSSHIKLFKMGSGKMYVYPIERMETKRPYDN